MRRVSGSKNKEIERNAQTVKANLQYYGLDLKDFKVYRDPIIKNGSKKYF